MAESAVGPRDPAGPEDEPPPRRRRSRQAPARTAAPASAQTPSAQTAPAQTTPSQTAPTQPASGRTAPQRTAAHRTPPPRTAPPRPSRWSRLCTWVADDLFAPAPRTRITPFGVLATIISWAVLVGLSLLRQRGVPVLDTVWAEDGQVFLDDAIDLPFAEAVARGYAGYLHVVPRLAAGAVALLPIDQAAAGLAIAGAGIAATCGVLVFLATAGHLRSQGLRMLLGAMVVLQPAAGAESLNSLALAQWHLVFAAFWLCLWRPDRLIGWLLSTVVIAATILSAPLAFMLGPILALRAIVLPRARERITLIIVLVAIGTQTWALYTQPEPNSSGGTPPQLWDAFTERVATTALFGVRMAQALAEEFSAPLVGLVAVSVVGMTTVFALVRPTTGTRLTALLCAGTACVAFFGAVYARGTAERMVSEGNSFAIGGSRFVLVPILLVLSVLALVLDQRPRWVAASNWDRLRLGVLGLVLLTAGNDFLVRNDRSAGPEWSAELATAREVCARPGIRGARIQVSPDVPTFQLTLSCDTLQEPGQTAAAPP